MYKVTAQYTSLLGAYIMIDQRGINFSNQLPGLNKRLVVFNRELPFLGTAKMVHPIRVIIVCLTGW